MSRRGGRAGSIDGDAIEGELHMPTESIIVTSAVVAAFAFFAAVVIFTDMTWSRSKSRKNGG